jgi:hypothetical protein
VADGDEPTKGEVRVVRCSQEFIDELLRLEENPAPRMRTDFLDKYTGPIDMRGIILRCEAARDEVEAADAKILQQYRATGIAYTEAVYDPSA